MSEHSDCIPIAEHSKMVDEIEDRHVAEKATARSSAFWNGFIGGCGFSLAVLVIAEVLG